MNRQAVTGRSIPCLPGRSRSLAAPPPPLLVILRPAAPGQNLCDRISAHQANSLAVFLPEGVCRPHCICLCSAGPSCTERPCGLSALLCGRTSPRRFCSLPRGACSDKVGIGAGLFSGVTHAPTTNRIASSAYA